MMTAGLALCDPSPRLIAAPSRTVPTSRIEHRSGVGGLHGHSGDGVDVGESADAAHQILLALGDLEAGGGIPVGGRERLFDFLERTFVRGQACRIEHDLVLLLLAAGRNHLGNARNREQAPTDDGLGDGPQLQRRMPVRLRDRRTEPRP